MRFPFANTKKSQQHLHVISLNVFAQEWVNDDDDEYKSWRHRKPLFERIFSRDRLWRVDVICLQEITPMSFDNFFEPLICGGGEFVGFANFNCNSKTTTPPINEDDDDDDNFEMGCATFVRIKGTSFADLISVHHSMRLNTIPVMPVSRHDGEDIPGGGHILELEFLSSPLSICIINVRLVGSSDREHIREQQLRNLIAETTQCNNNREQKRQIEIIMIGDFGCEPNSDVFQIPSKIGGGGQQMPLLLFRPSDETMVECPIQNKRNPFQYVPMKSFASSDDYAHAGDRLAALGVPIYTVCKTRNIDHAFYSKSKFMRECHGCGTFPAGVIGGGGDGSDEELIRNVYFDHCHDLPSVDWPSDHVMRFLLLKCRLA